MTDSTPATAPDLECLREGIRLMALRALGDAALAEEVAQETLVRAHLSLRDRQPDALGAWVAGIARHVIADAVRSGKRLKSLSATDADGLASPSPDTLTLLCTEEESRRVRAALALLPPADRELLRLSYYEGLSSAEIAAREGAPPERVRQRKLRALERLRHAFHAAADVRHAPASSATIGQDGIAGATKPAGGLP